MGVIAFPKRSSASASLLSSALARPCQQLEAHLVLKGKLADDIFVAAGLKGVSVAAYIAAELAIYHGGDAA